MFMDKEKLLELSDKVSEIALKASQSIMDIYTRREITLEKKEDQGINWMMRLFG